MKIIDKLMKGGVEMKKSFDPSGDLIWNSRDIRSRYHRIREKSYSDDFAKNARLDRPIFIVGVPHSGTSVLVSTFKSHPDLANWTEAPEVWEPYWAEGQDSEYNRLVPKYETDVEPMDVLRITDAFYRHVKSQHKKRLVNKNPRNTVRIGYMKKIFPDAKIIHIFRDGRDVVNSITRNMPSFMIEKICDRWINSLDEVKKQSAKISKNDFYEIRYEEFCETPRDIIKEAYEKCELDVTEHLLQKIPEKLHNFNGKWKKEMGKSYHALLKEKLSAKMEELNYTW